MAIFADVVDEWKKAGPKEKLLIAGGGVGVIVLAIYLHSKSTSSSTPGSSLAGTGTAGVGGSFQPATGSTPPPANTIPLSTVNSAPPSDFSVHYLGPPVPKPTGAATSAPKLQTSALTSVYANTRHSPSAMPVTTQQSAPPQMRPR